MNKLLNWLLWLLITIAGTYLIFMSVDHISTSIWLKGQYSYDDHDPRWLFGTLGFFHGVILGLLQWVILRNSAVAAYSWILITPLGLGIGLFAGLNFALVGHAPMTAAWYIATIVIVVLDSVNLLALFSVRSD